MNVSSLSKEELRQIVLDPECLDEHRVEALDELLDRAFVDGQMSTR